jgi:hypothetical protein
VSLSTTSITSSGIRVPTKSGELSSETLCRIGAKLVAPSSSRYAISTTAPGAIGAVSVTVEPISVAWLPRILTPLTLTNSSAAGAFASVNVDPVALNVSLTCFCAPSGAESSGAPTVTSCGMFQFASVKVRTMFGTKPLPFQTKRPFALGSVDSVGATVMKTLPPVGRLLSTTV